GEGKFRSLVRTLGGEEELFRALEAGNVSLLSSVDGISQRMAVELILSYRGSDAGDLLGTEPARSIYDQIIEMISGYMHTEEARNRTCLLVPGGDLGSREREAREVHGYLSLLESVDRMEVEGLLSELSRRSGKIKSRSTLPYVMVVEDDEALDALRRKGLDRRCLVISPEELSPGIEGDMILVTSSQEIDTEQVPAAAVVHCSAPAHEIIPETSLDSFSGLFDRIEAVSRLRSIYGFKTLSGRCVELIGEIGSLSSEHRDPERIREIVEEIRKTVERSLEEKISSLTLSGTEALSLLASDQPDPLKKIYREHSVLAADIVKERLGTRRDLFRMRYPLEVDEEALDSLIRGIIGHAAEERFSRKVRIARELVKITDDVKKELEWARDLDYRFGLACFTRDLGLSPFDRVEDHLAVSGAADLSLRKEGQYQGVNYHLGPVPEELEDIFPDRGISDSRTAMLTGANSGGKTTLLMTLAQVVIMSQMGLPVPADRAFVPGISRVFIYKPKRRLDAGGLETFLKEILPLSTRVDERSLVLADELEAMTELEAASRIIGVFLSELTDRKAFSVVVTHMADEIGKFVECRTDGIEARGLDEDHNLLVDRNPVIGLHARSTPELILKKLEARSRGREKEVYSRVLEKFQ
ncbi:MAG: MutS-related protein, partial [Thermoplasmatota archaeon]